jgi:hypothetical protein
MSWGLSSNWLRPGGVALIAAIAVATLIPAGWQIRTGLHWLTEHFAIYFAVTVVLCLAWPRPFLVAGTLMVLGGLLEALQGLTADRVPDFPTALFGAAGVASAALVADLVMTLRRRARLGAATGRKA